MGKGYIEGRDDTIKTNSRNDTLIGGSGNDRYVFNREFGKNIIDNYDESKFRILVA